MKSFSQYMEEGNLLEVRKLIENGVKYNVNSCLASSSYDGFIHLVKYFVNLGADVHYNNNEALLNTTYYRHWDIYLYLLEQGATLNDEIIKNIAQLSFNNDQRILYDVIEKGYLKNLLIYANEEIKILIDDYIEKEKLTNDLKQKLKINFKEEIKSKL